MPRKYRNYTDQDILEMVLKVKSLSQLLDALSLRKAGGNYANMKRNLQRLKVNTDHWTGKAWNKGEQLKDWSDYTRNFHKKKHVIALRGHRCEECRRVKWRGNLITLELDHIDGDRTHNELSNFRLLCPNCHSYTPTWRKPKF